MRVIKNINNNVSICIDGKGNELVALGKGIGFRTPPYEITDLSIIQKTYYNISQKYFELFQMIPYEYFELSGQILEYARDRLQCPLNPNLIVTLADHIQFAVNRCRKGLHLNYSGFYGLKYSNPEEYEIGLYALRLINNTEGVELEDDEVFGIAVCFINARETPAAEENQGLRKEICEEITGIIEEFFGIHINRDSFNYMRFATHINYLLWRGSSRLPEEGGFGVKGMSEVYGDLSGEIQNELPQAAACARKIGGYLEEKLGWETGEEEILYLILHINRLCVHEECDL